MIEAAKPTLFIDELDTVDPEKRSELVGIINSSHCVEDAIILRTVAVGDGHEVRAFSTWAAIALAAIGHLPSQWVDRSITIAMQRKGAGEHVERMRRDRDQGFGELARKAARWAGDHLTKLGKLDPTEPAGLHDRAADNWRFLLAIAEAIGGDGPEKAREAALALSGEVEDAEDTATMLLADIRAVFEAAGADKLPSATLVEHLVAKEGRPWAEMGRARKPLTTNALARLLKRFGVAPGTKREGEGTFKGYARDQFAESWSRYLPPEEGGNRTVTPSQASVSAGFSNSQTVTRQPDVTVPNPLEASVSTGCDDVTVGTGGPPDGQAFEAEL